MAKILWVDDEIEFLKPHIILLESKGHEVDTAYNGEEALELSEKNNYDIVFLDEMMPGMDGLSVLEKLKDNYPYLKVVMVTKSEEESLMEEAIGAKIDDYLTKPVNPSQILLAIKKQLESGEISQRKMTLDTVSYMREISEKLYDINSPGDWIDIFNSLMEFEIALDETGEENIRDSFNELRRECNTEFCKYVEKNYESWVNKEAENSPLTSVDIVEKFVYPHLKSESQLLFIVIDCLRYDQWLLMEKLLQKFFNIEQDHYFSILPTATPYSRNSLFSGLWPDEIHKKYSDIYSIEKSGDKGANQYERQMLDFQVRKLGYKPNGEIKYFKVFSNDEIKRVKDNIQQVIKSDISALVVNSVDIIAHSRADTPVLKEIAPNEKAYRQLSQTWFEHSPLFEFFKELSRTKVKIVLTSDHGSIRVLRGAKVIADKETSVNLRYKFGRNLKVNKKQALILKNLSRFRLPNMADNLDFILAKEDHYFVYPTNYHHYLSHYKDSFQHGGISMEEMILPVITLTGKK